MAWFSAVLHFGTWDLIIYLGFGAWDLELAAPTTSRKSKSKIPRKFSHQIPKGRYDLARSSEQGRGLKERSRLQTTASDACIALRETGMLIKPLWAP
jgi:hypothetical protein